MANRCCRVIAVEQERPHGRVAVLGDQMECVVALAAHFAKHHLARRGVDHHGHDRLPGDHDVLGMRIARVIIDGDRPVRPGLYVDVDGRGCLRRPLRERELDAMRRVHQYHHQCAAAVPTGYRDVPIESQRDHRSRQEHARLELFQPGVFLPASVVALALDGNVSVSGRDCSGTLVMVLMNPAHRVELTLTQRSTETTPSIDVDIQPGTNRSITVDDDPSDAHTKHVVITGETIVAVMVNASPGQMVLREVCCERDYAFHLVAQDSDTTVGPFLLDSNHTATAVGHDLQQVTVRSVGPYCLLQICATLSSAEAIDAYAAGIRHTQEELVRWSQPDV